MIVGLDRSLSGADDTDEFQDEVEVLREIWEKQGVGKDGYLTFHELGEICENMGMEKMSDKVCKLQCSAGCHIVSLSIDLYCFQQSSGCLLRIEFVLLFHYTVQLPEHSATCKLTDFLCY